MRDNPQRDGIDELFHVYFDVLEEARKNGENVEYWQGKKDGIRTAMAMLALTDDERHRWEVLMESSRVKQETTKEKRDGLLKDACYYIGEILWIDNGKRIAGLHIRSRANFASWYRDYKRLMKHGIVPSVTDDCFDNGEASQ